MMNELFMCSDASESHSFIFDMTRYRVHKEKHFELVRDFEFSSCEKTLSSGFRELLSVIKFTETYVPVVPAEDSDSIIYWLTDSKKRLQETTYTKGDLKNKTV